MTHLLPNFTPIYQVASLPTGPDTPLDLLLACANGLFRSIDSGATWQSSLKSLQLPEALPVLCLAVSPSFLSDRTIFAGAPGGGLRSVDGGATWKVLSFPAPPPSVTCALISPRYLEDGTVILGTSEDGVLISTNGGDAWQPWNFGLIDPEVLSLAVSPAFSEDETLFCGTASGLFRSSNAGRAWREVELPAGQVPILSLAVSPGYAEDRRVYAGSEEFGLYGSADGGDSWARIGADALADPINAVLAGAAPDLLVALHSEELQISRDRGGSWQHFQPEELNAAGVSALHAPRGLAPGLPLVLALNTGRIVTVNLN